MIKATGAVHGGQREAPEPEPSSSPSCTAWPSGGSAGGGSACTVDPSTGVGSTTA